MTAGTGISKFFDLSVQDQIEASLMNGGGDCFFLFSGPPLFRNIGANLEQAGLSDVGTGDPTDWLCPLLFTTNFSDPDHRPPDGVMASFGTLKTIAAPSMSNPAPRSIAVGSMALVTSRPARGFNMTTDQEERWNLLKRFFWWLLNYKDADNLFVEGNGYIGDEHAYPQAIAPEVKATWGNFSRSSFYKMPVGVLAVALNKSGIPLSIRYYEGCVLQQVGPQLQAALNQPITLSGNSTNIQLTYTDVKTFTAAQGKDLGGNPGGPETNLFSVMSKILKDGPTTT